MRRHGTDEYLDEGRDEGCDEGCDGSRNMKIATLHHHPQRIRASAWKSVDGCVCLRIDGATVELTLDATTDIVDACDLSDAKMDATGGATVHQLTDRPTSNASVQATNTKIPRIRIKEGKRRNG